jgi:hypothetical protein
MIDSHSVCIRYIATGDSVVRIAPSRSFRAASALLQRHFEVILPGSSEGAAILAAAPLSFFDFGGI